MNCPYCKQEMEEGYIQSLDNVSWNCKEKRIGVLASFGIESIKLTSSKGPLKGNTGKAFKCNKCKIILMKYE